LSRLSKTPASDTEPQEIDTIRRILDEATESAKVGLISLATEIERELRLILASRGVDTTRFRGVHGGIAALQGQGHFLHLYKLGEHIWGVRNQLIHGTSDTSSSELVRTIDLGIGILRALYAIPHAIHTVLYAELAIYEDNACTIMRLEVPAQAD
jgi:hypothetical protein